MCFFKLDKTKQKNGAVSIVRTETWPQNESWDLLPATINGSEKRVKLNIIVLLSDAFRTAVHHLSSVVCDRPNLYKEVSSSSEKKGTKTLTSDSWNKTIATRLWTCWLGLVEQIWQRGNKIRRVLWQRTACNFTALTV